MTRLSDLIAAFFLGIVLTTLLVKDCRAGEWARADKALFGAFLALQVVDGLQTYEVTKHPERWEETNSLYGKSPSAERIVAVKVLTSGLVYYMLDKSPSRGRRAALLILDGLYVGVVAHNHQVGVRINF